MSPNPNPNNIPSKMYWPVLLLSKARVSATNFTKARFKPEQAIFPNTTTVFWMIPNSPKPFAPKDLPKIIEAAMIKTRERTEPIKDQDILFANR